jgi:hypothetical protein
MKHGDFFAVSEESYPFLINLSRIHSAPQIKHPVNDLTFS